VLEAHGDRPERVAKALQLLARPTGPAGVVLDDPDRRV